MQFNFYPRPILLVCSRVLKAEHRAGIGASFALAACSAPDLLATVSPFLIVTIGDQNSLRSEIMGRSMGSINWAEFTPWTSLAGGALIGLAAAAFIVFHGRIMGVSSILSGLVLPLKGDIGWRVTFLAGVIAAPILTRLFGILPKVDMAAGVFELVIAGVFVGFGTSLGSGCTSGHGVCGIARLSPRSIVATCIFVSVGMATVYLRHHIGVGG